MDAEGSYPPPHQEDDSRPPTIRKYAPTVRFYDARGNVTGSASTYGNITKFYGPDGWLVGTGKRYAN